MLFGINKELPAIAVMTAIGYISCYLFQFGLLSYYGIPFDLASVDVNSLLFSMFIVVIFSMVIIFPVIVFSRLWGSRKVRQIAFSYMFLILSGISYYIASLYLGYYPRNIKDQYATPVVLTVFFLLTFIVVIISVVVYFSRKMKENNIDDNKVLSKSMFCLLVAISLILATLFLGDFYAKVIMAKSFYKNTDYFFVLENSKGIIVASCNEKNGVSFKRIKSDEADFYVAYRPEVKKKVKHCFDKWSAEKLETVSM